MFNFFNEIKKQYLTDNELLDEFNIINLSGRIIYIEGHKGVSVIMKELIAFKVKKGRVEIHGQDMYLLELTSNTMAIRGSFFKVEYNL